MTSLKTVADYQRAGANAARTLGVTLARFMLEPDGPQIAAISLDGFDTHANQGASEGQLAGRLAYLDSAIRWPFPLPASGPSGTTRW